MDFWQILLAIVAGGLVIYYYAFRGLNFFKGTGVPYIRPIPLCGNMALAMFRRRSAVDLIQDIYWQNPDAKYVGFFDLMTPTVVIRDPELIKTIGVKNFENFRNHRGFVDEVHDPFFAKNLFSLRDEKWREARAMLSPAFTSSKMKSMFVLMFDCAKEFADMLANMPKEKRETLQMKDVITRYANDVIATCAFGVSVNSMKDPKNEFYTLGRAATNFDGLRSLLFFLIRACPKLAAMLGIKFMSNRASKFFMDLIRTTVRTRDEKGITRPDMIQLMMEARGKRGEGEELTIVDMTAQAMIFIFGGFETTSSLMCFAAHEIAVNPDIQATLQEEIDRVLKEHNGVINYDIITNMEYLDACINEALRMYPIMGMVDRLCSKSFELPPPLPKGKPYVVKEGMAVWFSMYGLHHDPRYFENPDTFDPNRFMGDNKKNLNHAAYIPFGIGPRMCIGNRFALLEMKVLFVHLLARCNLKPCAKTGIPLRFSKKTMMMTPEAGFWLGIEPRLNPPYVQLANGKSVN